MPRAPIRHDERAVRRRTLGRCVRCEATRSSDSSGRGRRGDRSRGRGTWDRFRPHTGSERGESALRSLGRRRGRPDRTGLTWVQIDSGKCVLLDRTDCREERCHFVRCGLRCGESNRSRKPPSPSDPPRARRRGYHVREFVVRCRHLQNIQRQLDQGRRVAIPVDQAVGLILDTGLTSNATLSNAMFWATVASPYLGSVGEGLY